MFKRMSVQDFHKIWEQADQGKDCIIIDVRGPEEYAAGHVPGAKLIPLNTVPARFDEFTKDETVYLVCRSGGRSGQCAQFLAGNHGHENLVNVEGGTMTWVQAGYPVDQ